MIVDGAKAVCTANSPLQLLNVREAVEALGLPLDDVVAMVFGGAQSPRIAAQFERTREVCGFERWITIDRTPRERAVRPIQRYRRLRTSLRAARRIAASHRGIDYLIIGQVDDADSRFLIDVVEPRELVVVDEGLGTIIIAAAMSGGRQVDRFSIPHVPPPSIKARLVGYRRTRPRPILWFSALPLQIATDDKYVANEYGWLKKISSETPVGDHAYVIGQPFEDGGWFTESDYLDFVRRAKALSQAGTVRYIPHRRERPEYWRRLERFCGVDVVVLDVPVELHLATADELPREVIGHSSTALLTCGRIFGSRVKVRSIPIQPFEMSDHLRFEQTRVARLFESVGIEVTRPGYLDLATPST